jgi:hypothetical protein
VIAPAIPLAELSEKEWQAQVIQLARTLGFKHYFTYRSKRSPSGFPDLVLVRERTIFCELKGERGKPTNAQREWLAALLAAGAEVYLIRPRDLEALAKVLAWRGEPSGALSFAGTCARYLRDALRRELGAEGKAA